jgi:ferrochelatase
LPGPASGSIVNSVKTARPFDGVLVISFGGPGGPEDVRPFLANVLRGRRIPPERVEEVVRHYELFGGVSPLTELTFRQARGLEKRLRKAGVDLPVYVGMRNWRPYLADTLAEMAAAGVRRAVGFIAAAHGSYSSCTQYKENVRDAQLELARRGLPDVDMVYVDPWFEHPGFIAANADSIVEAFSRLEPRLRGEARIVFTAHSIPVRMARNCRYEEQLLGSCQGVMAKLAEYQAAWSVAADSRLDTRRPEGGQDARPPERDHPAGASWALVYQSRSGSPSDPWLGPDINDYIRAEYAAGLRAVVIAPIGFLCDHVEILYDLDYQAAATCQEVGMAMVRAATVGDAPAFLDAMADRVLQTFDRFRRFPPLAITGPQQEPVSKT